MGLEDLKELPHDIEAERVVLGSAISGGESLSVVMDRLTADDFYLGSHRAVFEVMRQLFVNGSAVDLLVVRSRLDARSELDIIGGSEYLAQLSEYGDFSSTLDAHVEIVRDKAVLRRLISACVDLKALAYSQSRSVQDILETAESKIYGLNAIKAANDPEALSDVLVRIVSTHLLPSGEQKESQVINTGFYELDQMTTGFHPGELVIVAGRPSMGKSSFLLSMAANIAAHFQKVPVAVFSLEMSKEQCASNILCGLARVSVQVLRESKHISKEQRQKFLEAADQLSDAKIIIDDSAALAPSQLRSRARRLKEKYGIGAVLIDYLQLMRGDNKTDNRQQEVAEISRNLKLLAKELGIPIIAGSQISREAEASKDNKPKLSHLRESGAIEQDADLVMLLYREEYYKENTEKKGIAEIIIAKQRNGPTGSFEMRFFKEFTRFENLSVGQ